ncbi:sensor histidine kinase [Rhodococcus sp. BP-252]|uniref:sensor histidine kinase n=1 Tax=unclassified Rhodococcus (in: high G+C Gram-positive bacteria) TaxID=192944 RepID=UPI001C9AF1F7|nr:MULTISPECIES: histidine kinase [unclassified Rhodococcus (in: high G+C Gram-positive bacteria)]MBY6411194.1 sensor histidine kinase [Rhodococcus sp. BP-320]MBY6415853.1 sensor histidine kinase [Rhodococcus sp. BP-321]MBY6423651.1 sensor histidine kinase [Rhodococcus sp. BP-324]MBY6425820.1 sensor histidine kinase [Rhodococcus sp. BP-323]MBY6431059.1 sensor histidine kinase [Rhodococcus sp. BP-322]
MGSPVNTTVAGVRRLVAGRVVDVVIVLVTAILYAVAWPTLQLTHDVSPPLMPIVAALAVFPFLLVRANPALGWAISAASALVVPVAFDNVPGYDYPWQVTHIMVMLVLVFAVSLRCAMPIVGVAWGATVLLFLSFTPGDDGIGWAVGFTAVVVFGLLVRWLVLSRRQLARQEEVSELERARRAILEEKAKIARDLHDVVAHHMSLVVVQAQSAPYRLDDVSPSAAAEFESIGATAREALNEIRGMLGVLRSDGHVVDDAPQPSASDVDALLVSAQRAGVRLTWTSTGQPSLVSAGTGLALYRILQESLSNAARHAPDSDVRVRLDYGSDLVFLEVINGPSPAGVVAVENSGGHGVQGMRDRARGAAGWLDTRPLSDGGFEVVARLPVDAIPVAAPSA